MPMIDLVPLPYPSFTQSVKSFSDMILPVIANRCARVYPNLSAMSHYDLDYSDYLFWRVWREHKPAFAQLSYMCIQEMDERGLPPIEATLRQRIQDNLPASGRWYKPAWVGWEELHEDHKRYLVFTGSCEQLIHRIAAFVHCSASPEEHRVTRWLDRYYGTRNVYQLDSRTVERGHNHLALQGAVEVDAENHYSQFEWPYDGEWRGFDYPLEEVISC